MSVYLSVYAYAAEVPGQTAALPPGCPSNAVDRARGGGYRIAAPDVNGGKAYWYTFHQGVIDDGGTTTLVWQTPSGTWASVSGTDLDPATVQSTLEHVARTATVGAVPVSAPVQITRVPAKGQMQLGQETVRSTATGDPSGYSAEMTLTMGTGAHVEQFDLTVYPSGENPYAAAWDFSCDTFSGWQICAEQTAADGNAPPADMNTLLQGLVVQGQDSSTWSADLIAGTK